MPGLQGVGGAVLGTAVDLAFQGAKGGLFGPEVAVIAQGIQAVQDLLGVDTGHIVKSLNGPDGLSAIHSDTGSIISDITNSASDNDIGAAVWLWNGGQWPGPNGAWAQVGDAGAYGTIMINLSAIRFFEAYNFIATIGGTPDAGSVPTVSNLLDCRPAALQPGETDLQMLQRLHPEIAWQDDYFGSGKPGGHDTSHDPSVYYIYWPIPALDDIRELFAYIPASGPPKRYASTDMCRILSMLPVQWGDHGTGP